MHQFNWTDCVNKLRPSWSEAIGQERGFGPITFERLRDRSWFGCCYVQKWQKDCLAFPVCDLDGRPFRAHCRAPERDASGRWTWTYEPYPDSRPIYPLVFGTLVKAQRIYLFESQWDGVALIATLNLWDEIDAGFVAVVATRGAQYAEHLKHLSWPKEALIYAFPQNDKAGQDWLEAVLSVVGGCYVVEIPKELNGIKDLNEWIRDGKAAAYDIEALIDHSIFQQPKKETQKPKESDGDKPHFKAGHSLAWYANQKIDHKQTLLGNRYLCRGGGMFVIAPSGTGKSTLSLQMAILWCCGLVAFGIKPRKALRILIVQSEDDQGDCTEMAAMKDHLQLTEDEERLVDENTELIRCNDLVSFRFIEALKHRLSQARDAGKPFDLVIINPYGVLPWQRC